MPSKILALLSIPLLLASCSAPDGDKNAEDLEAVTITSTVTSGETPTESTPQKETKTTQKKSEPKSSEVDPGRFYAVNAYGNEVWSVSFRGGDLVCQFSIFQGKDGGSCLVKNWKDAPRNLEPDKLFFGTPLNSLSGGEEPFEAHHAVAILPDGGQPLDPDMSAGQKTTINGFEIAVDEDDTVMVRHGDNFFTFDGTLTTQSWSQHPDENGWSDPGAYCGRGMGQNGEIIYFLGKKGGSCDQALEAMREYDEAFDNGEVEGNAGSWSGGQWSCIGDSTYAPGTSGVDRLSHCELGEYGDVWATVSSKYPKLW